MNPPLPVSHNTLFTLLAKGLGKPICDTLFQVHRTLVLRKRKQRNLQHVDGTTLGHDVGWIQQRRKRRTFVDFPVEIVESFQKQRSGRIG
jgi:hypothetical protein